MKFVDFLSCVGLILILSAGFGRLILGSSPVVLFIFWAGVILLVGIIVCAFIAALLYMWERSGY